MDALTDFIIPIIGLKLGEYSYQFKVDGQFFKEFDNTDLQEGSLQVDLVLKKRSNLMELMFRVKGSVNCLCDRCGDDLELPLDHQEMRIVKFSQEDFDNTDDVLIIGSEDHEINVSHIVYETIFLGLPIRKFHEKETNGQICDEEVIKRLKEYQEKDEKKGVDDRWSALKNLLTDKE
ncbi:MAG: DUF177 domain-containing protein [Flavobacteriales bacterium]|nr:DUF177 domain-containing protein [Flavobacteriales bacterium]